jgi:hypothetical protein
MGWFFLALIADLALRIGGAAYNQSSTKKQADIKKSYLGKPGPPPNPYGANIPGSVYDPFKSSYKGPK